jgi:hypothetical protein
MDNEQTARELVKVLKKPLMELIDEVIEHRCYLVILEILKNIKK